MLIRDVNQHETVQAPSHKCMQSVRAAPPLRMFVAIANRRLLPYPDLTIRFLHRLYWQQAYEWTTCPPE